MSRPAGWSARRRTRSQAISQPSPASSKLRDVRGIVYLTNEYDVWVPFVDPQTLSTTGIYAILLDPAQAHTGTVTVTLYDVPAEITGSLTTAPPSP
jgi:hypothetical protein